LFLEHLKIKEIGMDLKLYYQKIRDTESKISDAFPIVMSLQTDDGGKSGCTAEVTRAVAAKMITEGTVRLATAAEAKTFREDRAEAKRLADEEAEVAKVQVTVVPSSELARLAGCKKDKA
jgi:hypothetical protein